MVENDILVKIVSSVELLGMEGIKIMKKSIIIASLALMVGCVTPPQTTDELRAGVQRGAALSKMEQIVVNRSFNATFNSIKKNADRCFNVTVTSSTPSKYGAVYSTIRWRSSSKTTGKGKAETVIQQDAQATGMMPPGGYYVMLVDTGALSAKKTKVSIYGSSVGYGKVYESIFAWARGKKHKCPKKPFGGLGSRFEYHNK
jgi:hypothetical protein